MNTADNNSAPAASRSRFVRSAVILMLVVIAIVVVMWRLRSGRMPIVTRIEYDAAKALWDESKPPDYDITVQVSGMQPGLYEVGVENDIATSARFDGRDLKRQRTFGTWAVTGMFDTLARDLETNDKHGHLMLRAEFDPKHGFPTRYERIEMRTGIHDALQWEVTKFAAGDRASSRTDGATSR